MLIATLFNLAGPDLILILFIVTLLFGIHSASSRSVGGDETIGRTSTSMS